MVEKLATTVAPIIAGILITVSYFPQIKLTIQTKDVDGQSISFWAMMFVSLALLAFQQWGVLYYSGSTAIMGLVTQALNATLALAMLYLVIVYKKRQSK